MRLPFHPNNGSKNCAMPSTNPSPRLLYYWDANVFIDYLEETPARIADIEAVIEEVQRNQASAIYTSALSIVEVAFLSTEKNTRILDPSSLARINALWTARHIQVVEFNPIIANLARDLMRAGIINSFKLKPYDATHLATAQWLIANRIILTEFHTYDTFNETIVAIERYTRLRIRTPKPFQPTFALPASD